MAEFFFWSGVWCVTYSALAWVATRAIAREDREATADDVRKLGYCGQVASGVVIVGLLLTHCK